uniref:NR LBD domain-containing protein n=1 Tax=Meloidogyne hapla TaxID=6305 RepID=A0A1I8BNX7_MELHA
MPFTMLNETVNQQQEFPPMELCLPELNRRNGPQMTHINSASLQALSFDDRNKQISRANSFRSLDESPDQDKFVERHNTTAEIYQIFKDNVDSLFSRKIVPEKQAEFLNHILAIVGQLLMAMEAEKQYLVAAQWTQQMNYSLLNTIDTQILGGRAFGLNRLTDDVSIQCLLITDETHEEFAVEPMIAHLKNVDLGIVEGAGAGQPIMVAKFEDMACINILFSQYNLKTAIAAYVYFSV